MRDLVIDNFAGGGGASTGIEAAIGRPVDYAINHDADAIAMHEANHPQTVHLRNDIWSVDPREVVGKDRVRLAWFSPDCTHFSKAAGKVPRKQTIRDLAWVVIRWAREVRPDVIMLENVEEFVTWGPLDSEGYPIKARSGETFNLWWAALEAEGYTVERRELRAADYGAPTIRKRLFIIACRDGYEVTWPDPTHMKPAPMMDLEPWRTAAECIDWSIPCPSIFERDRELAEATQKRIAAGIWRFVVNDPDPFIVNLTHGGRLESLDEPFRVVTAAHRGEKALVTPYIARTAYKGANGAYVNDAREPFRTLTAANDGLSVVVPHIVQMTHENAPMSVDAPLGTITTQGNKHQLVAAWMTKHFGGMVGVGVDTPLPTTTTRNTQNQLTIAHLTHLRGTGVPTRPDAPLRTIAARGTHIAEVRALLLKFYGTNRVGASLRDPMHTVTTKDRIGLVTVHGVDYVIYDIGMRMLTPRELYRAQGFPESYIIDPIVPRKYGLDGEPIGFKRLPKTAQVRMVGNSVCPQLAEVLVAANVGRLGQQHLWPGYETAPRELAVAG